jgi:hypothetical protein
MPGGQALRLAISRSRHALKGPRLAKALGFAEYFGLAFLGAPQDRFPEGRGWPLVFSAPKTIHSKSLPLPKPFIAPPPG